MVRYERSGGGRSLQEILEKERRKIREEYEHKFQGFVESNKKFAESNMLLSGSLNKVTQMYERSEARVSKLEEEVYGLKMKINQLESAQSSQSTYSSSSSTLNYLPTIVPSTSSLLSNLGQSNERSHLVREGTDKLWDNYNDCIREAGELGEKYARGNQSQKDVILVQMGINHKKSEQIRKELGLI